MKERQTDRQTKRHINRQTDRKAERQKGRETNKTRTAWAVFKYCGTKTVPLRMKKKL
jgi:hypothetical protein